MVRFQILAFEMLLPLTPPVEALVPDPHGVVVALAHQERVALGTEGLVDQEGGGRPARLVERRLVQGHDDTVKVVLLAHAALFLFSRDKGT